VLAVSSALAGADAGTPTETEGLSQRIAQVGAASPSHGLGFGVVAAAPGLAEALSPERKVGLAIGSGTTDGAARV